MTQVSRRYLSPQVKDRMYEILIKAIGAARQRGETIHFLTDLLSGPEQIMLAKRLAIAYLLLQGNYTTREISEILKVSLTTIQRVSTVLDTEGSGYREIVNSLLRDEKVQKFMDGVAGAVVGTIEAFTKKRPDYGSRIPDPNQSQNKNKKLKAF